MHLSKKARITLLNPSYTENPEDSKSQKRFTDCIYEVTDEENPQYNGDRCLIECETEYDPEIEGRFMRYGSLESFRDSYKDDLGHANYLYPRMGLLYLRPAAKHAGENVFFARIHGLRRSLKFPLEIRAMKAYDAFPAAQRARPETLRVRPCGARPGTVRVH